MPANSLSNLKPKRILVITQRYLGDTLLITPLIHSLKQAYEDVKIDVLLPHSNIGILQGNPDIAHLITFPKPLTLKSFTKLLWSLYRQYDLAISLQTSDRTILCSSVAGKISLGFVETEWRKNWWKKWLISDFLIFGQQHAILENLRFCKLLDIKPRYSLIPPQSTLSQNFVANSAYAVLHIMPQWRYKQWHNQGWLEVIDYLAARGLEIVISGGNQTDELAFLDTLITASKQTVINLAGKLSLPELSETIRHAKIFIGPDTGITHLAAATGIPVVAIFGPTDPEKWAPWPRGYHSSAQPFHRQGIQSVNNVTIIQNPEKRECIPCQGEGCDRHRQSHSSCLDELTPHIVIDAIVGILDSAPKNTNLTS